VLAEKEKRKRHFLQRTIWSAAAGLAALLFVVLLFQSRARAIEQVRAANTTLTEIHSQYDDIYKRQQKAQEEELDARQKEVALRIRRLPGAFTRAVLDAVIRNHASPHIFLERIELKPQKRSFDLSGVPGETRSTGGTGEEAQVNIHAQELWPQIEVWGQLKKDTPDVGKEILDYYGSLRNLIEKVRVEGWKVSLDTTQPDRENRFKMTFVPVAPVKES